MPVFARRRRSALQYLCGVALDSLTATGPAWCQPSTTDSLQRPFAASPSDACVCRTVLARSTGNEVVVVVVDDATLRTVGRQGLRTALHAAPIVSADGGQAFFIGEGGWIAKLDVRTLQMTAEKQFDQRIHHATLSGDGQYLAIADDDTRTLTVLDANLAVLKQLPISSRNGQSRSPVQSLHTAITRRSFVVALRDIPEVWEISYNPSAPEIPMGVIHDFQYREGAFAPGFLNPMRTTLPHPVSNIALGVDGNYFIATAHDTSEATVVHLDVRRAIARWTQSPPLRWSAGYAWNFQGQAVLAAPTHDGRSIIVVGQKDGHAIRTIPLPGAPRSVQSHGAARHLWVITEDAANPLAIIDKQTLAVVEQRTTSTGLPIETMVFSGQGHRVFAQDTGGSVRVFDEKSLAELKRLELPN